MRWYMKKEKKCYISKLLSENKDVSCMRVMSIISLVFGGIVAILSITSKVEMSGAAQMVSVFVVSAFGGKTLQKHMESKNPMPVIVPRIPQAIMSTGEREEDGNKD